MWTSNRLKFPLVTHIFAVCAMLHASKCLTMCQQNIKCNAIIWLARFYGERLWHRKVEATNCFIVIDGCSILRLSILLLKLSHSPEIYETELNTLYYVESGAYIIVRIIRIQCVACACACAKMKPTNGNGF